MTGRVAFTGFMIPRPAVELDCKKRDIEMALKVICGIYRT